MAEPTVLFLDQSGGLGGAELCLMDYLRCRRGESQAVVFANGPFPETLSRLGVSVEVVPLETGVTKESGWASHLTAVAPLCRAANRVARLARSHDVIYANTQKAAMVGSLAAWLSRKPLVWHLHDLVTAEHFSRANRLAVVAATNRIARQVIANSEATSKAYRDAGGLAPVEVIYNGIDERVFHGVLNQGSEEARCASGLPKEGPVVGVFGRLTPWKGQDVLLEALDTPSLYGVRAIFVGDALYTDEDRRYADELRRRSAEGSLAGRVEWLGHRSDIAELMRACDIVVHTSVQPEPFGRVIVEGQLAGRPVVAAAAGGALEIVTDGVNGLLHTPGDASQLAESIRKLLAEPTLARRIAAEGRESALNRFRLEDRVREIDAVLLNVAAQR